MIEALEISRDLNKWIEKGEQLGQVHSIFENTINIVSQDGRFIPIYTYDKPMSPNSIRLKKGYNFQGLNISMGEKAVFTKGALLSKNLYINYKDSIIWDNRIKLTFLLDEYYSVLEKTREVKDFIVEKGNKSGIFPLMQFLPGNLFNLEKVDLENKGQLFIKDRFIKFLKYFQNEKEDKINELSKKIIGFGTGLTPSMDDFLSGLMIANLYVSYLLNLDMELAYRINKEIVKDIDNMTTRVSEEMLKSSARGQGNQDVRDLMEFIIGISKGAEIKDIMTKVIDFGHSSGTDILCGLYVGLSIKLNENQRNTAN